MLARWRESFRLGSGDWVRNFIESQSVARLATIDDRARPHIVPIVFAYDGERLYTPIDAKPKRVNAAELKRVRNISSNPQVAVLFDHYEADWRKLAWVQLHGTAQFITSGPEQEIGLRLLVERYQQYTSASLAGRPVIVVAVESILSWRAAG